MHYSPVVFFCPCIVYIKKSPGEAALKIHMCLYTSMQEDTIRTFAWRSSDPESYLSNTRITFDKINVAWRSNNRFFFLTLKARSRYGPACTCVSFSLKISLLQRCVVSREMCHSRSQIVRLVPNLIYVTRARRVLGFFFRFSFNVSVIRKYRRQLWSSPLYSYTYRLYRGARA